MREFGKRGRNAPNTPDGRVRDNGRSSAVAAITRLAQELSEGLDNSDSYDEEFAPSDYPARRRSDYSGGRRGDRDQGQDQDEVASLLNAVEELRADIEYMRSEPAPNPNRFAARNRAETEMYGVLEDLNSEINGLNIEQRQAPTRQRAPQPVSKSPEAELADLFADLKGDIDTPKQDEAPAPAQSAVKPSVTDEHVELKDSTSDVSDVTAQPTEDQRAPLGQEPTLEDSATAAPRSTSTDDTDPLPVELTHTEIAPVEQAPSNDASETENTLANLIADIDSLQVRAESSSTEPDPAPEPEPAQEPVPVPSRDESESFALLEELQGDIKTLRSEQAGPIAVAKENAQARREQEVFAMLVEIKGDIDEIKSEPKPQPARREPPRSTAHDELSDRVARLKDIAAEQRNHAPDGEVAEPVKKPRVNALTQLSSLCKNLGLKRKTAGNSNIITDTEIKADEPKIIEDTAPTRATAPDLDAVETTPTPDHEAKPDPVQDLDTEKEESIALPSIALPMPEPVTVSDAISIPSDPDPVVKDSTAHEINRFLNPSKKSVATENSQIRGILAEIDAGISRFRADQEDETQHATEGEFAQRVFDFLMSLRNSVDARLSRKAGPPIVPKVEHVLVDEAVSKPDKKIDPEPASIEAGVQKSDSDVGSDDSGDAETNAKGDVEPDFDIERPFSVMPRELTRHDLN